MRFVCPSGSACDSVEIVAGGLGDSAEVRGAAGLVLADAPQFLSASAFADAAQPA